MLLCRQMLPKLPICEQQPAPDYDGETGVFLESSVRFKAQMPPEFNVPLFLHPPFNATYVRCGFMGTDLVHLQANFRI